MMIGYSGLIMWSVFSAAQHQDLETIRLLVKKLQGFGCVVQLFEILEPVGSEKVEFLFETVMSLKASGIISIIAVDKHFSSSVEEKFRELIDIDIVFDSPLIEDEDNYSKIVVNHGKFMAESCKRIINYLELYGFIDDQVDFMDMVYQPGNIERLFAMFPVPSLLLLLKKMKKTGSIRDSLIDFTDDLLQFVKLRKYNYKHKILFVAGLPKSGTTWLEQMLDMIPGYHSRYVFDPTKSVFFHDITPLIFDLIPNYSYSVVKLHTRYSAYNFHSIISKVDKFIILYRDLRDMCVSRYFHVLNEPNHRHNKLYRKSKEKGILHCMNVIRAEYVSWVQNWYMVAKDNTDKILQVKYEDLNTDVRSTMKRVLSFFDITYSDDFISEIVSTKLRKNVNLAESLARGKTERKGIIGDWKNHFSDSHKHYFKQIAGQLLIDLGYENDLNW